MLRQRVLSGLVGVPLVVVAIWFGNPLLFLLVAAVGILGFREFQRLQQTQPPRLWEVLGYLWVLLLLVNASLAGRYTAGVLTLGVAASLLALLLFRPGGPLLQHWAWLIAGALYVGWLLSYALLLRAQPSGQGWLLLAVLSIFIVDTAAFFTGRAWGHRQLAPTISPNKTWEGALGGLGLAILSTPVLSAVLHVPTSLMEALGLGLLVGVLAQAGDLFESSLKRGSGVKDAGTIIPGHGGILDRLDSLLPVLPVVYYYVQWIAS